MSTESTNQTVPTYEELKQRVEELEKENALLLVRLHNYQANHRKLMKQYHIQLMADGTVARAINNMPSHFDNNIHN